MSGELDFEDHVNELYQVHDMDQLPLDTLKSLLLKAVKEIKDGRSELEDFQLTSKEYEQELENANEANQKRAEELEDENEQLQKELQKIQQKYKNEVSSVDKENEQLKKSLDEIKDQAKINFQRLRNLEIDNEGYERQLRISEQIIQDLEQKLDSSLEELALQQQEHDEYKQHSQEQLERVKQQLEETNTELQVKERELKKIKFQQLLQETSPNTNSQQQFGNAHAGSFHQQRTQYITLQKQDKPRLSEGKNGNVFQKLATSSNIDNSMKTKTMNFQPFSQLEQSQNEEQEDHMFEQADQQKRPESARVNLQVRESLLTGVNSNNQAQQQTVEEEIAQESKNSSTSSLHSDQSLTEEDLQEEEPLKTQEDEDIESVKVEQVEDDRISETKHSINEIIPHQEHEAPFQPESNGEPQKSVRQSNVYQQQEHQINKPQPYMLQEGLGPYITGNSYGGALNLLAQNDFDENLLMDELDIDELLECDDIESNAFISSSKQLLSVIDNMITSIDDRLRFKKNAYYVGNYYYGGQGNASQDEYAIGSFRENNLFGGSHHNHGGYHKHQSQSTNMNNFNHGGPHHHSGHHGERPNATDVFDKTRKVSVLY